MRRSPDAIVCLPATLGGSAQWQPFRRFWTRGHEILTPDLAYEGAALPERPRVEMFADILMQEVALLAATVREGAPVHLIGHSYGGVVACRFVRLFPERVRTLVLIEPVCFDLLRCAGPADLAAEVHDLKERCREELRDRPLAAAELFVSYWGGPGAWAMSSPAARERAARGMTKVVAGWDQLWEGPLALGRGDFGGPVLLLAGTRSPAPSRWIARHCAAEVFAGSQYAELDGAGHFGALTHAPEVVRLLERVIDPPKLDA
jgi:pimeloyl-ACP methyl ester carboxylesterase